MSTTIKARLQSELSWDTIESMTKYQSNKREKPHLWSREEIYVLLRAIQKEGWSHLIELSDSQFETLLARNDIQAMLPKICQSLKEVKLQFADVIKYRGMHPAESMPVKSMFHVPVSDEEKEILVEALEDVPSGTPNRFVTILQKFDFHESRIPTDLKYVVDNMRKREGDKKRKRHGQERSEKRKTAQAIETRKQQKKRRKREERIDMS
uniref:Uncharacterized protein n=1 Tax=Percolomonas cosmopolitus TaxID=63605 RepID=A0A7S1PIU3_9EUKA|mmetsp:Transcript_8681/g.32036  ORF Transcript_8681/g.32036 Transcript_8681/m.32036 type:complete len:209 (+) Transcript_8681:121-747(+)